jgi:RHS repeat-associated protein
VVTANDYYPFGMQMPGRKYSQSNSSYRYGFNGKENDNEVKGEGNQIDYGWRVYDPRIGKFLSVDPLQSTYPELTPYQFAGNTPIQAVDLDGREIYHYTLFFQADGKAPILTYLGEQKNEMATWPLDAIDRGKSEGFKTYNGDKITNMSIQVHVVAREGSGIAYKPAEAIVTFSSFKAMNDWKEAGYQGTEDEIAFAQAFQQKLEEAVFIASVTTPGASAGSRVGRGAGAAKARTSPKANTAKQATSVNGKQLTKAEMASIKGGTKTLPKYENPGHHDPSSPNFNSKKSVLPSNHNELFNQSTLGADGNRWTKVGTGKKSVYHRFQDDGNGNWHWNGSTNSTLQNGASNVIQQQNVPVAIKRLSNE